MATRSTAREHLRPFHRLGQPREACRAWLRCKPDRARGSRWVRPPKHGGPFCHGNPRLTANHRAKSKPVQFTQGGRPRYISADRQRQLTQGRLVWGHGDNPPASGPNPHQLTGRLHEVTGNRDRAGIDDLGCPAASLGYDPELGYPETKPGHGPKLKRAAGHRSAGRHRDVPIGSRPPISFVHPDESDSDWVARNGAGASNQHAEPFSLDFSLVQASSNRILRPVEPDILPLGRRIRGEYQNERSACVGQSGIDTDRRRLQQWPRRRERSQRGLQRVAREYRKSPRRVWWCARGRWLHHRASLKVKQLAISIITKPG